MYLIYLSDVSLEWAFVVNAFLQDIEHSLACFVLRLYIDIHLLEEIRERTEVLFSRIRILFLKNLST